MGWAGGSRLLDEVAEIVMPHIGRTYRAEVARKLIEVFQGEDCDTFDECRQEDIRRAVDELWPLDDQDFEEDRAHTTEDDTKEEG